MCVAESRIYQALMKNFWALYLMYLNLRFSFIEKESKFFPLKAMLKINWCSHSENRTLSKCSEDRLRGNLSPIWGSPVWNFDSSDAQNQQEFSLRFFHRLLLIPPALSTTMRCIWLLMNCMQKHQWGNTGEKLERLTSDWMNKWLDELYDIVHIWLVYPAKLD